MSFSSALFFAGKFRRIFSLPLSLIFCFGIAGLVPRAYATPATTAATLAVTASGSAVTTVASGTVVTLTATVLSGATAVTPGQVNFCDASAAHCTDIHLLGTAQLTSSGTAVLKLRPGIGSHSYDAVFVGTSSYSTSTSSAASLSVTGFYTTTTAIAQSGSAGNYTLTATVAGLVSTSSAPPAPAGTVSFLDTTNLNEVLGTANLGAGTLAEGFAGQVAYSAGSQPVSVAVGDFNGDGIPDLAVANYGSNTVGIFLGNGDGTFQSQVTYATGTQPNTVAVGDFNGDGKLDLAVTNGGATDNTVGIFLGNGDGTFQSQVTYATSPQPTSVAVGDFNGDGIPDLVVVNSGSSTVSIFLGKGDGTFPSVATYATGGQYPRAVAVGDFNGDGKLDLAAVIQPRGTVSVLLGNGDGTFQTQVSYATGSASSTPLSVAVGDFNGDGIADLAVANLGSSTVSVLLSKGDGTFNAEVSYATGAGPVSVAVGDFNGDGIADLAVANQSGNTVGIFLGNGDGTFQSQVTYATGNQPNSVAVGDFSGDGIPDLAVANNSGSTVDVLLGQWTETAMASASGISPVGPSSASHAVEASYPDDSSFNGSTSSTTSLTAEPVATTVALSANPASSTYGRQVVLTATLSPYTAQGYSTNGDAVTFSSNGTSLGTGTLSSGVATLNVTSLPVGTDTLTATYAGDSNFDSSNTTQTFNVGPAPTKLAFGTAPAANILPGGNGGSAITVDEEDSTGALASLAADTITLTVTGPNSYSATYSATASGGVATFNLSTVALATAGSYTYTAASGSLTQAVANENVVATSVNLGSSQSVGTAASAQPVTIYIATAGTLNTINVLTQGAANLDFIEATGGTCATGTAYTVGQTCTVNVIFTPKYAGLRMGAVALTDGSGNVLATEYISGVGQGPQVVFPSNTAQPQLGPSGNYFVAPKGVAVDASGNVYVADAGSGTSYPSNVYEMPSGCKSTSCIATLGSGWKSPNGVAVDGDGNTYVADPGGPAVYEMTANCKSTSCRTALGSGFGSPSGVAVDGSGNVYVADPGVHAVYEMTANCKSASCMTALGGGFSSPRGVAVDASGNVYVADSGTSNVYEMTANCTSANCKTTLGGGGYNNPTGVAVAANGNIYVMVSATSMGGGAIYELTAGCASASCATNLSNYNVYQPWGVALDGAGNIYDADSAMEQVYEMPIATPPTLSFANTIAHSGNSSDSPKSVTVANAGNGTLTFTVPTGSTSNPSVSQPFLYGSSSTCTQTSSGGTAYTLASGASCTVAIDFAPTSVGSFTGADYNVGIADNALNSPQQIGLSGTGTVGAVSQLAVSVSPASITAGASVNVTVTAEDQYGDTVTTDNDPVGLTVNSNSVGSLSLISGVASGSAQITAAGTMTITATDTTTSLAGVSNSFTVDAGPAANLAASSGGGQSTYANTAFAAPLSATVTDQYSNPVSGVTVGFAAPSTGASATLSASSCTTGSTGSCSVTATANGTTGGYNVTASVNGISNAPTFSLTNNPPPNLVVTSTGDDAGTASNCTVQTSTTSGTDSSCSLRDALLEAASLGTANIYFDSSVYASAQTITLANGSLTIPKYTAIYGATSGSGATLTNLVTVSGNNAYGVFVVGSGVLGTSMANLTITNGHSTNGGGISNSGTLTITGSTLSGNTATLRGGGIFSSNRLTITGSTLSGNTAPGGGGIYISGGFATVTDSTFSGNSATGSGSGGGIYFNQGTLTVTSSTFSGNSAGNYGGGIYNYTNSSGITVTSSTLSGNTAQTGGGIFGKASLANSIVAGNTATGSYADLGLSGPYSAGGNLYNAGTSKTSTINPNLAPLGNYGGSTQTMIPLPGSAAVCGGTATPTGATLPSTDQRGDARTNTGYISGTTCVDSGAVQTNYSLAFSQQPTDGAAGATIAPAPTVQLDESGAPIALSGVSVSMSADAGTLSGTTTQLMDSNGQAAFTDLSIGSMGSLQSADTLTASVTLTSGSPAETLSLASSSFNITAVTPTITFTVADHTYGDAAFSASAASNSSGAITYSVISGPATISGSTVTLTGVGTVKLEASQATSGGYVAATQDTTFNVSQATPTITISNVPVSGTYGGNFTPAFAYTGDGTASVSSNSTGTCTVTSGVVHYVGVGSCSLTASATAGTNYSAVTGTAQSFSVGQATPTISISNLPASGTYGGNFTPALAYTGDGTTSVISNSTSTCTVTGGVVHYVGVGNCSLTASATAGTNYSAVTGTAQSFSVGQATPTISISNLPASGTYGGNFTPALAYTGDGTTSLSSNSTSVCTVTGGVVHYVGVGSCSLTASATAGTNYTSVTGTVQTFSVGQATPTITISNVPASGTYGGNFTPSFSYTGDGTTSVISNSTGTCTVTGGVVHYVGVGICSLTASATAGTNYTSVTGTVQTFSVGQATPTITISDVPASGTYGGNFTPSFSYTGDGTTSLISNSSSVCTVTGGVVHYVGVGTCSLTASATAGTNYSAATGTAQTFNVGQATPTISISNLPASGTYGGNFTSAFAYTGDGTTSVISNSSGTCTVTGGVVHYVGVGTCSLTASATAGTNYSAVTGTAQTFSVGQATPTISISNLPASGTYGGNFTPAFAYTGDGTASVSSNSTSTCTVTSGVVHYVGVGSCSLTASATAGTNYSAVTGTAQSFSVGQATPTILISNLPASGTYGGNFTPSFSYTGDGTTSLISNSSSVCTVTSGVVHYVGVGTCSLTASATAGTNYSAASGTVQSFSVGQATPTITTPPTAGAIAYGQTLSNSTLSGGTASYNGNEVSGTFSWNVSTTSLDAGTQIESVTFIPTDGADYTTATASVSVTVNKATAIVMLGGLSQTYSGSPLAVTATTSPSGLTVNFTYNGSATVPTAAGSYAVVGTISETNYQGTASGTLVIGKAMPTITALPTASAITYGQTLSNSTLTGGTASVAGSFMWATSTTLPGAGTPSESVTFKPTDTTDYNTVMSTVTLTVNKATPTINWPVPSAIAYGTALSAMQLDATANYNGTTVPGIFTYIPASGTVLSRGTQTLSATFTPTDTADYNSVNASVAVSVGSAALTVSANDATKTYGTANPAFTGSISGALNGDTFTESFATTATTSSNVGTYAIVPSAAGANLGDYTETIQNGTLSVTKAGSAVVLTSSTTNANLNANVTFTAMVTSETTGSPTGSIEFLDGSTVLDTVLLNSTGVATYSTTKLAAGAHSINAVYVGDQNFTGSSISFTQTVTAPDYSLAANPASLTLKAGQTGNVTFTFTPVGGYTGMVSFACTGLPANASCGFAPSSLTADGSNKQQTSQLTITTEGPNTGTVASNHGGGSGSIVAASIFWLPGLLFGCFLLWQRKKLSAPSRQLLGMLILVAAISGLIGMTGCAFGNPQAPSGGHIVTVTATATASASGSGTSSSGGGLPHTASFTLTITQ